MTTITIWFFRHFSHRHTAHLLFRRERWISHLGLIFNLTSDKSASSTCLVKILGRTCRTHPTCLSLLSLSTVYKRSLTFVFVTEAGIGGDRVLRDGKHERKYFCQFFHIRHGPRLLGCTFSLHLDYVRSGIFLSSQVAKQGTTRSFVWTNFDCFYTYYWSTGYSLAYATLFLLLSRPHLIFIISRFRVVRIWDPYRSEDSSHLSFPLFSFDQPLSLCHWRCLTIHFEDSRPV